MTVHASEIEVTVATFEARFDDGYRYLDRCGETISHIRKRDSDWGVLGTNPQAGTLANTKKGLSLEFNVNHIVVTRLDDKPIKSIEAEAFSIVIGTEARDLYGIITDYIAIPNTTRVGARFTFSSSADSIEDANRFVIPAAHSEYVDAVAGMTGSVLYEAQLNHRFEDPQTGIRRSIRIATMATVTVGAPPMTGLPGDEAESRVVIDIDTFTRPEEGHLQNANLFVQNSYVRAYGIAFDIFQWLRDRRKSKKVTDEH